MPGKGFGVVASQASEECEYFPSHPFELGIGLFLCSKDETVARSASTLLLRW